MLRTDLRSPSTFLLNLTNLALGIATALCLIIVIGGAAVELWVRGRRRLGQRGRNSDDLWWAKRQFKVKSERNRPDDW